MRYDNIKKFDEKMMRNDVLLIFKTLGIMKIPRTHCMDLKVMSFNDITFLYPLPLKDLNVQNVLIKFENINIHLQLGRPRFSLYCYFILQTAASPLYFFYMYPKRFDKCLISFLTTFLFFLLANHFLLYN